MRYTYNQAKSMCRIFLIAGFIIALLACNNVSNNDAVRTDSSGHAGHQSTGSKARGQDQVNPVTEIMTRMMQDMHNAKPTGDNDIDFAAMMVEHHKSAVAMSEAELKQGSNTEMKAFALKVIDDQNKEIGSMQAFISKAPETASSNAADFQKALDASMTAMMSGNTTIYKDIDKDFATQMIPHHQSAVDMAEAYLQYGKEVSLRALCQNIINSQTKEIKWLKEWLAKNK
ncbi:MAG: DUF305 domain-containing protein [Daejeonella sp.]